MSKIDAAEVARIAALAKISLKNDEIDAMAGELAAIVDYVERLQSVDVDGVEETSQVTGLTDVTRPDEINTEKISQAELLKNAPERTDDGYIKVKRVLG